jgi:hypothetical protein
VWPSDFKLPWTNVAPPEAGVPTAWAPAHSSNPPASQPAGPNGPSRTVRAGDLLVGDAIELFKAAKGKEADAGLISPGRIQNIRNFLARAAVQLGSSTRLAHLDRSRLEAFVLHFRSRPPRILPDGKKGDPISSVYAKSIIDTTATLLRWSAKHLGWKTPADLDAIFEVPEFKPLTEQERKARHLTRKGEVLDVFSVIELRKLYQAADQQVRAWMLLGLNCAFTQVDLSDLRVYEVEQGAKEWRIERAREKTNVDGSWVLWPETVAAMRAVQAPENEHERWFLSPTKKLLVQRDKRSDYVARQFSDLVHTLGMKCPTFKSFRKTSATVMLKLSGSRAFQDAQTAHSEGYKMAQHYADRQWEPLHDYQRKMREHFTEMWSHQRNLKPANRAR